MAQRLTGPAEVSVNRHHVSQDLAHIKFENRARVRYDLDRIGTTLKVTGSLNELGHNVYRRGHLQINITGILEDVGRGATDSGLEVLPDVSRTHRPVSHNVKITATRELGGHASSIVIRITIFIVQGSAAQVNGLCIVRNGKVALPHHKH